MASVFARFGGPEIIRRASYASYNSGNGYVRQDFGNNTAFLAFSGSLDPSAIHQIKNKFGVGKINENNDYFESMVDGTTRKEPQERAIVYREALTKFLDLWKDIKAQNTRAGLALRAAGEAEHKLEDNRNKLKDELAKLLEGHMTKVKEYRTRCLNKNVGYYDAFREQKEKEDFQTNLNRLSLAAFYDKLEDMVETHQVPDDFQFIEDLIKEGTEYRLLVELLGIANYYRLGKHEDSGHYIRNARPRRYKALEKWLADINSEQKKPEVFNSLQGITKNSLFWANVEEVSWIMSNPRENLEVKRKRCNDLQSYVNQLLERQELCVEEVVMGESSIVKWWRKLSPQDQQASPISYIFGGRN